MRVWLLSGAVLVAAVLPAFSLAASPALQDIYDERTDLQASFDAQTFIALPDSSAGFLIDLEDWARQYGWKEYAELADYKPVVPPVELVGSSITPDVSASNYIVVDEASGEILAAERADVVWPIASMTKLITVKTALDHGLDPYVTGSVEESDEVGGARLGVLGGTTFLIRDLLYAALVGSANNAANAVARETGIAKEDFVALMNETLRAMHLSRTHVVDPTGIEVENVSTARDVAYFAREIFRNENIRHMTGTARMHLVALNDPSYARDINNTNWLLYDRAYDDVYVTAGKTGYLDESKWNLVVRMHPMGETEDQSVLVVVMGADGRRESFDDAQALARWAWNNFDWSRTATVSVP